MPRAPRLLSWSRTDLPSKPKDDYTGLDPKYPRLYARVYLAPTPTTSGRWFWTVSETGLIGTGYAATVEAAVEEAERAYVRWRDSKTSA